MQKIQELDILLALGTLQIGVKEMLALEMEKELGYFVKDGKYWKHLKTFDSKAISRLDSLWSEAIIK